MKSKKRFFFFVSAVFSFVCLATSFGQDGSSFVGGFRLSSTKFANDEILPISTIDNITTAPGVNGCSMNGAAGGDESPELFWNGAPPGTKSFVVATFDATASFTHWGMYNISAHATGLPQNAGKAGSQYGTQIVNDFGVAAEYDGPCPPAGVAPYVHRYIFTVYALDEELPLLGLTNFPANSETLYQALIAAGREQHILASASLTGLYSTTPGNP